MITIGWLCLVCLVVGSHAYPGGAPEGACGHMTPSHGGSVAKALSTSPFSLTLSANSYLPGDKITVTINGTDTSFKGILLQARAAGDKAEGWWDKPERDLYKRLNCGGETNSAVTHINPNDKLTPQSFVWIAPCNSTMDYTFYATVVQEYTEFYVKIPSTMVTRQLGNKECKPPGSRGSANSLLPLWTTIVIMIVHLMALLR
uniref:Reelin domain-containing protein n=1 Tax=Ciona savignyi TaxID=51511 RepID=H2ZHI6_CIOSA